MKRFFLALLLGIVPFASNATHVMGGEVTYTFLGQVGSNFQYEIKYAIYTDDNSNFPNGITNINTGIYDKATNTRVGNNRNLLRFNSAPVTPDLPPGCTVPGLGNLSLTLNEFRDTVSLPGTFSEYFTWYEVCCRNNVIDNLVAPGSTGNIFLNSMAPNFVRNTSPQFNDLAIPFLCAGDTTSLSNNATDPDGDFLVYKFVDNNNSQVAGPGFPQPTAPITYNPSFITTVPWSAGHSLVNPFGPGSYAFINSTNGFTEYYAPNNGEYNLTIEIEEYRDINNDGVEDLIGTTRRELQFFVRTCAPNDPPEADDVIVNGNPIPTINGTANIDMNEGDILTFNVNVTDDNNDSIEIFMEGDILDGTNGYTGPLATFPAAAGNGAVSSTFNWAPTCGITGQYIVRLTNKDYGCPPKSSLVFYNINVREFESADEIFVTEVGETADSVCFDGDAREYFTTKNPTALKQWEAFGGTINGSNTSDTVNISWSGPGTHSVRLIETSALGCADTAEFSIVVVSPDVITAGSDTTICPETSVQIFSSGSSGGYQWSPNLFLNDDNAQNPIATPDTTITYYVTGDGGLGCATTDSVTVTVSSTVISAGDPLGVCHLDTIQIGGTPAMGVEYSWDPGDFLSDSTSPNPFLIGENFGAAPIVKKYLLYGLDTNSTCQLLDSVDVTIYPLPITSAGLDDTICSESSTIIGSQFSPTQSCTWSTAEFLNDSTNCLATITPVTNLTVNETFAYVLEVRDGPLACVNYDTVMITAKPLPRVFAGNDTTICSEQLLVLGDSGELGVNYNWVTSSPNPVVPTNSSNPFQFFQFNGPGVVTTYQSIVTALDTDPSNLCSSLDTVLVTVNRLPDVDVITDTSICSQESINVGGTQLVNHEYVWNTSFGLSDSTVANPVLNINNPTDTSWFYTYQLVVTRQTTGCIDSADFLAEIRPLPFPDAGQDISVCSEFTDTIGAPPIQDYIYSWSPATGLSNVNISAPEVTLTTPNHPDSIFYEVLTELNGCFDADTVKVRVNPLPRVDTIFGGISICPDLTDVQYYIIDTLGFINYEWFAQGGTVQNPSNNDTVFIDWGPANPNAGVFVIPTNEFGCKKDTAQLSIVINTTLTSPPPVGDTSVCLGTAQNLIYEVPYTSGYNYTWGDPGIDHSQLPVGNGNQVLFSFTQAGIAQIFVEQTVTTVTSTCLGFSDTLFVTVHPDPLDTLPIIGDTSLCEFTAGAAYQINGFPNSTYFWNLTSGGTLIADTSNTALVNWGTAGTYSLSVFETSEFGCTSGSIQLPVTINPLPEPQWEATDSIVCPGTEQDNIYMVNGFINSKYSWTAQGGNLVGNDSADSQLITWNLDQTPLIVSVFEITEFGCTDVPLTFEVLADTSRGTMENVNLDDPENTSSSVTIRFNKGSTSTISDTLYIERSVPGTADDWIQLGAVKNDVAIFVDTVSANRMDNIYTYRIATDNLCGLRTSSLLHNTIRLEGSGIEEEDRVLLSWNDYVNWRDGVEQYRIYRKLDTQSTWELYETTNSLDYTDFSANDAFVHQFYIEAVQQNGGFVSRSNAFTVEFENLPLVANMITPNNDGSNDTWKIDNRELYGTVKVQIVDRYGNVVYENDNYQNDWDGQDLNPGTYYYLVVIEQSDITSKGPLMILK